MAGCRAVTGRRSPTPIRFPSIQVKGDPIVIFTDQLEDGASLGRAHLAGEQLKQIYEDEGLNMLAEHAQFEDDRGNGVEAGITEILMRMETGRFKVYRHLHEFFEEFRLYHRKDGKIVKEFDDILCAVRYALMCIRFAAPIKGYETTRSIRSGSWMTARGGRSQPRKRRLARRALPIIIRNGEEGSAAVNDAVHSADQDRDERGDGAEQE